MLKSTRTSINYSKHPILQKIGVAFKFREGKRRKMIASKTVFMSSDISFSLTLPHSQQETRNLSSQ